MKTDQTWDGCGGMDKVPTSYQECTQYKVDKIECHGMSDTGGDTYPSYQNFP